MSDSPYSTEFLITRFVRKHDCTEDHQFNVLVEELGELAEARAREAGDEAVAEELADVLFVAHSIAAIRDIDIRGELHDVAAENLHKDTSTDGSKVTKEGVNDE